MSDIAQQKKSDRLLASKIRQKLVSPKAGEMAAAQFLTIPTISNNSPISLYWPIGSELDTRPLLEKLADANIPCLLPVVAEKDQPLIFRQWKNGDPLEKGGFGTLVPKISAPLGIPKIVVVPLLSFDECGYRLGYGGGFYDRTLEKFRREEGCISVAFAYSGQQVETVTIDRFDQRVDWVVTEKYARKVQ